MVSIDARLPCKRPGERAGSANPGVRSSLGRRRIDGTFGAFDVKGEGEGEGEHAFNCETVEQKVSTV
jgi:hypothetical protein